MIEIDMIVAIAKTEIEVKIGLEEMIAMTGTDQTGMIEEIIAGINFEGMTVEKNMTKDTK